jgi:hypothetical protein
MIGPPSHIHCDASFDRGVMMGRRVLDMRHHIACIEAIDMRKLYEGYIATLVSEAATTGRPILRSMEFVFPHQVHLAPLCLPQLLVLPNLLPFCAKYV